MKKNLIALTVASLCVLQLQAQNKAQKTTEGSGVYIQVFGGYGLQTQPINGLAETSGSGSSEAVKLIKTGLGRGINAGINIGKSFSDNIGFELGINYFMGSNTKEVKGVTNVSGTNVTTSNKLKASMINVIPALVIKSNNEEGANIYAKFGPAIGFAGKITQVSEGSAVVFNSTFNSEEETKLSKGIAFGIQTAIGLDFPISDKLSFGAELFFRDQKYAPKEGEITKYNVNGTSQLNALDISAKKVEFVNEVKASDNTSSNNPSKELKSYSSLSSFGLNIGIKFKF
jgi:opacity protein-like surface antigen